MHNIVIKNLFSMIVSNKSVHISLDYLKEPETQTEKQFIFVLLSSSSKAQGTNKQPPEEDMKSPSVLKKQHAECPRVN